MNTLFLIPARGGSKGLPRKNIKSLLGKPLISYSIDLARQFASDDMICVSTDDKEIIDVVTSHGLNVPFIRPIELASDKAGSYGVIKHALNEYSRNGKEIENLVLLQPTSPLRTNVNLEQALALYHKDIDAVVSVKKTNANPYFSLFEEDDEGFLRKIKDRIVSRRQDLPDVYELNGSIYIYNVNSVNKYNSIIEYPKTVKYLMTKENSVDIDDLIDFQYCEFLLNQGIVKL